MNKIAYEQNKRFAKQTAFRRGLTRGTAFPLPRLEGAWGNHFETVLPHFLVLFFEKSTETD